MLSVLMFKVNLMNGMNNLMFKLKNIFKKHKKNIDLEYISSVVCVCRSLGVQELGLRDISIRLFPNTSSDLKPSMNNVRESKVPTESTPIKTDDKDISLMEDVEICLNPSGYMRRVERGELNLDKDFGDGTGEEI